MKLYYVGCSLHIELDAFTKVALNEDEIDELHKFIHRIRE